MADTKVEQMSVSVAKDPSMMTGAIPTKEWMEVPAVFKPGNYCYPGKPEMAAYLGKNLPGKFGESREWKPEDEDWKLPENWKEIIIQGRCLRRQVPLLPGYRRPQEHAGAAGRTFALGVSQRVHQGR
jgi:hypothetical protein